MLFDKVKQITEKPDLYCRYTAETLWNDPYISRQMLKLHLNPDEELASRKLDFIEASASFMQQKFGLREGKTVIDFGCGPGLYSTRFAKMGCRVRGLDFSANSIEYARSEAARLGLDIEYQLVNYLDYQASEAFDLVAMIYCDYCVLNDKQRKLLLKIMKESVKDDGFIFMDVCSEPMYKNFKEGITFELVKKDGFWSAGRHYVFKSAFKYDLNRVSLDKYSVWEKDRNIEIYNWLKYFTITELNQELKENGLEIFEVYSDVKGTPYYDASDILAVVIGKKS